MVIASATDPANRAQISAVAILPKVMYGPILHRPIKSNCLTSESQAPATIQIRPRAPRLGEFTNYDIGNNRPVEVPRVVTLLEQELGRKAKIELAPMQPGDVQETCADVDDLMRDVGFRPATSIEDGVQKFVSWYRQYHRR